MVKLVCILCEFNVVCELVEFVLNWDCWYFDGFWMVGFKVIVLGELSFVGLDDWCVLGVM